MKKLVFWPKQVFRFWAPGAPLPLCSGALWLGWAQEGASTGMQCGGLACCEGAAQGTLPALRALSSQRENCKAGSLSSWCLLNM